MNHSALQRPDQFAIVLMNTIPFVNPYFRQFPYCYSPFYPDFEPLFPKQTITNDKLQRTDAQIRPEINQIEQKQPKQMKQIDENIENLKKDQNQRQLDITHPKNTDKPHEAKVIHKVAYFDINNAPMITSYKKYCVTDKKANILEPQNWQEQWDCKQNKWDHLINQSESNQFIVFPNRKCKKKYRQIMKKHHRQDSSYFEISDSMQAKDQSQISIEVKPSE